MKKKVAFGLIGCGEIAVQSAKAISDAPNCELAAVQDVNEDMARDLADKYGVQYRLTWEDLLADKCVTAVYIATPHYLHTPAAVAAAEKGKHVLVEKPIATTVADANGMIEACKRAGVALSVAFPSRYIERTAIVKEIVDDGAIGRIIGIDFGQYTYKPESYWTGGWTGRVRTDWRVSREKSGGGVYLMNLVHTVDLLRYLTGLEAVSVAAQWDTFRTDVEVEDHLVATMRYDNGAIGAVRTSTIVEGKAPPEALEGDRLIGLEGQIFMAPESLRVYFTRPYKDFEAGTWHTIRTGNPWGGRDRMFAAFAKAVLAGKEPPITGLDGRRSLEVCLAAYRSGETGSFVTLPLAD
ncbi:MAG: Gfo/Idh/MocA family protein [Planctomycetota bacterium]|jgi:predicted dehydrogenase